MLENAFRVHIPVQHMLVCKTYGELYGSNLTAMSHRQTNRREGNVCLARCCRETEQIKSRNTSFYWLWPVRLVDDVSSTAALLACVTVSLCITSILTKMPHRTKHRRLSVSIHCARAVSSALLLSTLPRYAFNRVTVTPSEKSVVGGGGGSGAVLCGCRCCCYFAIAVRYILF